MTDGKKYFILLFAFIINYTAKSQYQFKVWSGNLGAALYKQSFGVGDSDVTIAGPALRAGITDFPYSNNICPPAGSYSIVQKVNVDNCSNGQWRVISFDHRQETFGNMMLVHNISSFFSRVVYVDTLNQDLCAGTLYEFSAAIINVNYLGSCSNHDFPTFRFSLEDVSGHELQAHTTPAVEAAAPAVTVGMLWKYSVYGFDYEIPVNMNKIILKITLLSSQNDLNCNNDFAIDDIMFSPAGPVVNIAFDGSPESLVTGLCFQDNKSVSMTGSMDPFYPNPAFQWQETSDNGITWKDIPGAVNNFYSQSFSEPDTFLFRLRGSDASLINYVGCGPVSNVLKVEVDGIPSDLSVMNNSPLCAGDDLTFTATGGASYTWSGPNGFFDDISTPHIFHSSLADSGTYYAQIKTFGGCTARDSTHVTVIGIDVPVTAGANQSLCKGQSVQLHADGGASYVWAPAKGLSDTSIANPIATPEVTTTYTVKASDQSGCSNSGSVIVKLLNSIAVKAAISSTDILCHPYDSAAFKDNSRGEIKSWNWDFGNGSKSILQDPPTQNYSVADNATDYTVRLTVKDTAGCTDTAYHVMKVENNCYIAVPSAFTPNGDGINDYLSPLNAYKATHLLFRVFNRNGQLVFETRDWTKKWDGTFKGNPVTSDVFVWELSYTDASNKKVFLKGSTLLIR